MRTHPYIACVKETASCRIMQEPEALPVAPAIALTRDLNRQEHDLMAAFEKFKGKVNVMKKRTT